MGNKEKVIVGMSGGVDSSVAALLLQQSGYEVVGVMLRLWSEAGFERENQCCSLESADQARSIAAKIGIPFYLLDASEAFYKKVVEPFSMSYLAGDTPNPCALCNPLLRWHDLLQFANHAQAKFVATGHYVRLKHDDTGNARLFRGKDRKKDQSYFISRLSCNQLQRSLFPLGEFEKTEIRQIARDFGLSCSEKPESQDICFVGDGDYRGFLSRNYLDKIRPGLILDTAGNILGQHTGLPFYTIGQRKKLGIAARHPLYVIEKRASTNELIVGEKDDFAVEAIHLNDLNWIGAKSQQSRFSAFGQFRYRSTVIPVQAEVITENRMRVYPGIEKLAVSTGQIGVLYSAEDEVLVSGTIFETERPLMTLPAILFSLIMAVLYASIYHLIRGGNLISYLIYLVVSIIGFFGGQYLANLVGIKFITLGTINFGIGSLSSIGLLLIGSWISRPIE